MTSTSPWPGCEAGRRQTGQVLGAARPKAVHSTELSATVYTSRRNSEAGHNSDDCGNSRDLGNMSPLSVEISGIAAASSERCDASARQVATCSLSACSGHGILALHSHRHPQECMHPNALGSVLLAGTVQLTFLPFSEKGNWDTLA